MTTTLTRDHRLRGIGATVSAVAGYVAQTANRPLVDKWVAVPLTAAAGALVAMQAPINSTLGRNVGTFAAASISFATGTLVLVAICAVGGGFGDLGNVRNLSWYYLIGGA